MFWQIIEPWENNRVLEGFWHSLEKAKASVADEYTVWEEVQPNVWHGYFFDGINKDLTYIIKPIETMD